MIRGQKRALDKRPSVNVNLNASIHNRFDIEVVDAKTGEVKQRAQAENIITDYFWKSLGTSTNAYYIAIGSGSGTPSASDVALFNKIANIQFTYVGSTSDPENCVATYQVKVVLSESEYVGKTLTEVGLGDFMYSGKLLTHAMLQDMNGNPISIQKTDTDIITIYATVFCHWQSTYGNGNIVFCPGNGPSAILKAAMGFGSFSGVLSMDKNTAAISNYSTMRMDMGSTSVTIDHEAKTVTFKSPRVAVGSGNTTDGVQGITFGQSNGGSGYYYANSVIMYPAAIMEDPIITGEVIATGDGSTKDFKTKFSPAYDIQVLVDGVAASVTVDNDIPAFGTNIAKAFIIVPEHTDVLASNEIHSSLSLSENISSGKKATFYNPYFSHGISAFIPKTTAYKMKIEMSNNLVDWVTIVDGSPSSRVEVPTQYQEYKYISITGGACSRTEARDIGDTNIHFATPPASGAVITANYKAKCIAKDENHVFDFSMTIHLGEYTK